MILAFFLALVQTMACDLNIWQLMERTIKLSVYSGDIRFNLFDENLWLVLELIFSQVRVMLSV